MLNLLQSNGLFGVEVVDEVIYARLQPHLPDFTATADGDVWQLAFAWPLRATEAQIASWNSQHPTAPMDLYQGETRIQTRAKPTPQSLHVWSKQVDLMVASCTEWRRSTRQRDEGM